MLPIRMPLPIPEDPEGGFRPGTDFTVAPPSWEKKTPAKLRAAKLRAAKPHSLVWRLTLAILETNAANKALRAGVNWGWNEHDLYTPNGCFFSFYAPDKVVMRPVQSSNNYYEVMTNLCGVRIVWGGRLGPSETTRPPPAGDANEVNRLAAWLAAEVAENHSSPSECRLTVTRNAETGAVETLVLAGKVTVVAADER